MTTAPRVFIADPPPPHVWTWPARMVRTVDGDSFWVVTDRGYADSSEREVRLDVRPDSSLHDVARVTHRDVERLRQRRQRFSAAVPRSDLKDFRLSQLCHRMLRSAIDLLGKKTRTSFLHPITDVIYISAQEEVVRSHAWRIVAAVQDEQPGRNLSICQGPTHPGSQSTRTGSVSGIEHTVTSRVSGSHPKPAPVRIRFVNLVPKTVSGGTRVRRPEPFRHASISGLIDGSAPSHAERLVRRARSKLVREAPNLRSAFGARQDDTGRLERHRDLPLARNRGAFPVAVSAAAGFAVHSNFTIGGDVDD